MKKIIIIGAGISGLSLAYFLENRYSEKTSITLIEKQARVGGWIRTFQDQEVLFEQGPRGFRPQGKGELTLQLAQELGLEIISASPQVKRRYIAEDGQLQEVSLKLLLKRVGACPLLLENFKKKGSFSDESIASFFHRRFSKKMVSHFIYPLCQGIFAQSPEELSMKACFTQLWEAEQKYGSLTKAFFKRERKNHPLSCSFTKGMESLPQAIAHRLRSPILLHQEVTKLEADSHGVRVQVGTHSLEADYVVLASGNLFQIASTFPQKTISLTLVNMSFTKKNLIIPGFGFLCKKESFPLLGATFDSELFPEHNRGEQTRLCFMFKGSFSQKIAIEKAQQALNRYLHIDEVPHRYMVSEAKEAIYQYPIGHQEHVAQLESSLPPSVLLTGSRFYGVGINDCIHHAYMLAKVISGF